MSLYTYIKRWKSYLFFFFASTTVSKATFLEVSTTQLPGLQLINEDSNDLTDFEFQQQIRRQNEKFNNEKKRKKAKKGFLFRQSNSYRQSLGTQLNRLENDISTEENPEEHYRKALILWKKLLKAPKIDIMHMYDILIILAKLAPVGDDEAINYGLEALKRAQQIAGGSKNLQYLKDHQLVAKALFVLGVAYQRSDCFKKAVLQLSKAIAMQIRLTGKEDKKALAPIHMALGWSRYKIGQPKQMQLGLEDLKKAGLMFLDIHHQLDHTDLIIIYRYLGYAHQGQGIKSKEAFTCMEKSLKIAQRLNKKATSPFPELIHSLTSMGDYYLTYQEPQKALVYYEEAIKKCEEWKKVTRLKETAILLQKKAAEVCSEIKDYKKGETLARAMKTLAIEKYGKKEPCYYRMDAAYKIGHFLYLQGHDQLALKAFKESFSEAKKLNKSNENEATITLLLNLGTLYGKLGNYDLGLQMLSYGEKLIKKIVQKDTKKEEGFRETKYKILFNMGLFYAQIEDKKNQKKKKKKNHTPNYKDALAKFKQAYHLRRQYVKDSSLLFPSLEKLEKLSALSKRYKEADIYKKEREKVTSNNTIKTSTTTQVTKIPHSNNTPKTSTPQNKPNSTTKN